MINVIKNNRMFRRYLKPTHWQIAGASATYTAGTVYLEQVEVPNDVWVDAIVIPNAATIAGNVTVGVYGPIALGTDDPSGAALVVESASTAHSGADTPQAITFTETYLPKGKYYLALELSDATATVYRYTSVAQATGLTARYARGGGYGALTNPCPAATLTASNMPGLLLRVSR
jgi:hypothetical protein